MNKYKKIPLDEAVIVTCGDWDLKTCLRKEAQAKKIEVPKILTRWINLKKVFSETGKTPTEIKIISKAQPVVASMTQMLERIGLPLVGKHHSGIDDTKNIAAVALKMLEKGFEPLRQFIDEI